MTLRAQQRADWAVPALEKLSQLADLEANWDSYGAPAPTQAAIALAERVLTAFAEAHSEAPAVDPSAEGGVCIWLRHGNRYGDIECLNSGDVLAVTSLGGEATEVWELVDFEHDLGAAVDRIRTFVGR